MESHRDVQDGESSPKRCRIESDELNSVCEGRNDPKLTISSSPKGPIDSVEDFECETAMINNSSPSHSVETSQDSSPSQDDTSQDEDDDDDDDDDEDLTLEQLIEKTVSNFSVLSNVSKSAVLQIQQQIKKGIDPRTFLNRSMGVDLDQIPQHYNDTSLWRLILNMFVEPLRRYKLPHVNSLDDVVRLITEAKKIIVLTGAGVSVSCGIPDFRSRDGIYSRLAVEFPNLKNPQSMFDISYFQNDPRPFFKFAKDIYPGKFKPSPCHRFIKLLEQHGKLLRNYTQNIDTLEREAGIERVIECHGSFATASCTKCCRQVGAHEIRETVLKQNIPMCETCYHTTSISTDDDEGTTNYQDLTMEGIMKPDIVFFGEGLPHSFHQSISEDKSECDLLLVMGSSLKVRPVALIPMYVEANVPQVLINREPLGPYDFDVELLGDCDVIINHLCQRLGDLWDDAISCSEQLTQADSLEDEDDDDDVESNLDSTNSWQFDDETSNCDATVTTCCKERHLSVDSARDSGIGDNSNLTDSDNMDGSTMMRKSESSREFCQPKEKKSLADRLRPGTFHLVPPNRYIFPGAELYDSDGQGS